MNDKSRQPIPLSNPICPFHGKPCIEQRCTLWVSLSGTRSSPIAGGDKRVNEAMCAFHALLRINLLLLNKPTSPVQGLTLPVRGG